MSVWQADLFFETAIRDLEASDDSIRTHRDLSFSDHMDDVVFDDDSNVRQVNAG